VLRRRLVQLINRGATGATILTSRNQRATGTASAAAKPDHRRNRYQRLAAPPPQTATRLPKVVSTDGHNSRWAGPSPVCHSTLARFVLTRMSQYTLSQYTQPQYTQRTRVRPSTRGR
jgi:hypothetical protein